MNSGIDFSDINEVTNTPVDDDIVKASGTAVSDVGQAPVNVVVKTEDVRQNTTDLTPGSIESLSDMDVKVNVISDKASKVVNLKEVDEMIASEALMSVQIASYANEALADGLFNVIPKASFTNTPSKTNLTSVKTFVKNSIAKEEVEFKSEYNAFVIELLDCIKDTAEEQEELYLEQMTKSLALILDIGNRNKEAIEFNKNTVLPFTNNEFKDIAKLHICDIVPSDIRIDGKDFSKYDMVIENIKGILKDEKYISLIHSVNQGMNTAQAYDRAGTLLNESEYTFIGDQIVTAKDVVNFASNFIFGGVIEDIYISVRETKEQVRTILDKGKEIEKSGGDLCQYVIEHTKVLTEAIDSIKCNFEKLTKTSLLIISLSQFTKLFDEF